MRQYQITDSIELPPTGLNRKIGLHVLDPDTQELGIFIFLFPRQSWYSSRNPDDGYPSLHDRIQIAILRLNKFITDHSPMDISNIQEKFEATYANVKGISGFILREDQDDLPGLEITLPHTIAVEDKPSKIGFK